jgi:hypothetical protein
MILLGQGNSGNKRHLVLGPSPHLAAGTLAAPNTTSCPVWFCAGLNRVDNDAN